MQLSCRTLRISSSLTVNIWQWCKHDRPMLLVMLDDWFVDLSDDARSFLVPVIGRNVRECYLSRMVTFSLRCNRIISNDSWGILSHHLCCTEVMKRACRYSQFRVLVYDFGKTGRGAAVVNSVVSDDRESPCFRKSSIWYDWQLSLLYGPHIWEYCRTTNVNFQCLCVDIPLISFLPWPARKGNRFAEQPELLFRIRGLSFAGQWDIWWPCRRINRSSHVTQESEERLGVSYQFRDRFVCFMRISSDISDRNEKKWCTPSTESSFDARWGEWVMISSWSWW